MSKRVLLRGFARWLDSFTDDAVVGLSGSDTSCPVSRYIQTLGYSYVSTAGYRQYGRHKRTAGHAWQILAGSGYGCDIERLPVSPAIFRIACMIDAVVGRWEPVTAAQAREIVQEATV